MIRPLLRYFGFGLIALLLIGLLTLGYLVLTFTPDDYREDLIAVVEEHTGHRFVLERDLELHLSPPLIGFEIHGAALDDAPGFGQEPMLSVRRAEVYLQALPLLFGELHMHSVVLDGLQLRLRRNTSGHVNWQTLLPSPATPPSATPDPSSDSSTVQMSLQDLRLTDSTIAVWDDLNRRRVRLLDLNLHLAQSTLGNAVDVTLEGEVMLWPDPSADHRINAQLQLTTQIEPDAAMRVIDIQDTVVTLGLSGPAFPFERLEASVEAEDVVWDRNRDAAQATNITVQSNGAEFDIAQLDLGALSGEPEVTGQIHARNIDLPRWLALWQLEVPEQMSSEALQLHTLSSKLRLYPHGIQIFELETQLGETRIQGELSTLDLKQPRLAANLHFDEINLDAYLPEPHAPQDSAEPLSDTDDDAAPLPIDWLRAQHLDVRLEADRLHWQTLDIDHPRMQLVAKGGRWHLQDLAATMGNGSLAAEAQLDASGGIPEYQLNLELSQLEFGVLLAQFSGAENSPIQGVTDLELELGARGLQTQTVLSSLNGFAGMTVRNGSLQIGGVASAVENAVATIQQRPKQTTAEGRLLFESLSSSWHATDGRLVNRDLNLTAGAISVTGQGHVDLSQSQVDYQLSVGSKDSVRIPVRISGPFDDLSHSLDLSALAKQQLNEGLETLKQDVEDNLGEKLKEQLKEKEEEADETVRNLLEKIF